MNYAISDTASEPKSTAALVQAEPLCQPLPSAPAERWPEVQDLDDFIFRWEAQAPTVSDR